MKTGKSLAAWLRIEALFVFLATLALYHATGASWWLFAILFLVPDLSMLGYLANPRVGAVVYNLAHTYIGPSVMAAAGIAFPDVLWAPHTLPDLTPLALVWASHIAFDRVLGYGLKSPEGFKVTHLGRLGEQEN